MLYLVIWVRANYDLPCACFAIGIFSFFARFCLHMAFVRYNYIINLTTDVVLMESPIFPYLSLPVGIALNKQRHVGMYASCIDILECRLEYKGE